MYAMCVVSDHQINGVCCIAGYGGQINGRSAPECDVCSRETSHTSISKVLNRSFDGK